MTGRRQRRVVGTLLAAVAAVLCLASPGAAPSRGLTGALQLAEAMDFAYDADFAAADAALAKACGPAPPVACAVARAQALWWRISFDLENRSLDAEFTRRADAAVADAERWVGREPDRAEAWFYLGASYGARVNFRAWRKAYLAAARDGKRIKQSLERSLELDSTLHDANFGVGMYRYYADVAPAVLKFIRWLLALPGGNRVEGFRQMERARTAGLLMRAEATYQLYLAYIWYENRPDQGLAMLAELRARYPHNPLFLVNAAQIHEVYTHDRPAALAAYRELVGGAERGTLRAGGIAAVWGRMGAARQHDALAETDRAVEELQAVIAARPPAPYGAMALAHLELGRALDRLGRRDAALAAYRAALSAVPPGDPDNVRDRAGRALSTRPDRATADAYRRSIEGWRAWQRQAGDDAAAAYDESLRLRPADAVTRYRRGVLLAARGEHVRALADFERALAQRPAPAPPIVASIHYEAGRSYAATGDAARAAARYDAAARVAGADPATRDAARRARAAIR